MEDTTITSSSNALSLEVAVAAVTTLDIIQERVERESQFVLEKIHLQRQQLPTQRYD